MKIQQSTNVEQKGKRYQNSNNCNLLKTFISMRSECLFIHSIHENASQIWTFFASPSDMWNDTILIATWRDDEWNMHAFYWLVQVVQTEYWHLLVQTKTLATNFSNNLKWCCCWICIFSLCLFIHFTAVVNTKKICKLFFKTHIDCFAFLRFCSTLMYQPKEEENLTAPVGFTSVRWTSEKNKGRKTSRSHT